MMHSARRLVSLLLCLGLLAPVLSGCAKTSELDSAIAALASGGVAVYDGYDSTGPVKAIAGTPSAMRLTRWQLTNMLAQADAHMGMLGANIDAYEGTKAPKNAPTFSYFIAAWVQRGQGPLAQYAAHLMGTQDWSTAPHLTFPLLVVTMFIADAARPPAGTLPAHASTSFNWERLIAAPAQADGICSTVSNFVSQVVTDVENALTVSSNGFFASLWNVAVKLVVGLAEVVIAGVLTPLLSILNAVAGGLAAIGAIASTLKPWTVTVDAQPAQITVGEQQSDGQFVATLDAQAIDWPAQVSDCASVLGGVDLSKVSYADAPVTWKTLGQIPGLATVTTKDATIDANKQATLKYQTVAQQPEQTGSSCPSSQQSVGQGGVQVSVERVDVEHLQAQLANIAFSKLPGFVRSHLVPLFQSQVDSAQTQFAQLVSTAPTGTGSVTFMEMKPNCSPSPAPSSSPNTPEPSTAPTQVALAHLPLQPCYQIITDSDVQAGFPGYVVIPRDTMLSQVDKSFREEVAKGNPDRRIDSMPIMTCSIGKLPDDVWGTFTVTPGQLGYPRAGLGDESCRAVMGPELDYFGAACSGKIGSGGGQGAGVIVLDDSADYNIIIFKAPYDNAFVILKHLLHRLEQ